MVTTLTVFGLAFVVFVLALAALMGLEGTCSGRCEPGEPSRKSRCDFCPRRAEDDHRRGEL